MLARAWRGHAEDIDRAAKAAHTAFQKWGHGKAKDRKKHLLKIASLIEKHGDELATIECLDAGQALKIVRAQIARTAENFSFYAEYAEKAMDGRTYPVDQRVAQLQPARAGRPLRHHHALERAHDAFHLAHRSGARHRQHRHLETGRMVAAHRLEARADFRGGRPAALASSTWSKASAKKRARRWSLIRWSR